MKFVHKMNCRFISRRFLILKRYNRILIRSINSETEVLIFPSLHSLFCIRLRMNVKSLSESK